MSILKELIWKLFAHVGPSKFLQLQEKVGILVPSESSNLKFHLSLADKSDMKLFQGPQTSRLFTSDPNFINFGAQKFLRISLLACKCNLRKEKRKF